MDFRVKKLILEEGMKNIAETEGVKLEMNFDDFHRKVDIIFKGLDDGIGYRMSCSYSDINNDANDVFKAIENTRADVRRHKRKRTLGIDEYIKNDIRQTAEMFDALREGMARKSSKIPKIKNVIFNYPATIVFWEDGDKTVVKCQNDDMFDAEKGLAMAIIKKMNGGKGNYCEIFKPWIEKYEEICIKVYVAELMKESVEFHNAACETSADDIQDILEGKVDPLMIKADEEEEKPVEKSCVTCDHKHKKVYENPCKRCLEDTNGVLPKWEPKKKETKAPDVVKKTCWNCANHSSEKDKEPCCSCTTRRRNGTIHRNWEPKE